MIASTGRSALTTMSVAQSLPGGGGRKPVMSRLPLSCHRELCKYTFMDRIRFDRGWRAVTLTVALFAITLNAFQPLAHASAMRAGGPLFSLWAVLCLPGAADPGEDSRPPAASRTHECCLGLAHAAALVAPTAVFIVVSPIALVGNSWIAESDIPATGGIRDGPGQPRGPPLFA